MKTQQSIVMRLLPMLLPVIVLGGMVAAISWRTHGFEAFTTYSYALAKANPIGESFAEDFHVLSENGSRSVLFQESDHYTLMGIVFLKCEMICPLINQRLYQVYLELEMDLHNERPEKAHEAPNQQSNSKHLEAKSGLSEKLRILTLSFDRERDNVSDLIEYKSRFLGNDLMMGTTYGPTINQAALKDPTAPENQSIWQFAVADIREKSVIRRKLLAAGFWFYEVMPGMYNHSPYLYLIDPDGVVRNVYDPGKKDHRELIAQLKADVQ